VTYSLRLFCTSDDTPPLQAVFDWAKGQGVNIQASSADIDDRAWNEAEVLYKPERQPFVEASTGDLMREGNEEFVELLEDEDQSAGEAKGARSPGADQGGRLRAAPR
jgi:hypothetical protein